MRNTITGIWAHASACLLVTMLALIFAACALIIAIREAFSSFAEHCGWDPSSCHEPRAWIIVPFGLVGLGLVAIAAVALLRGLYLAGRHVRRTLSSI